MRPQISNVYALRYSSTPMIHIWTDEAKFRAERQLWVLVLKLQIKKGVLENVPKSAVADYEAVIDQIDLESIRDREVKLRHDVKARIEEFNALAGHQLIHEGMTSRDLTENVEQSQILKSMQLVERKLVAVLARLASMAGRYETIAMAGRSHNVPAQLTTLGKRFTNTAEELLLAYNQFCNIYNNYPLRGIKGPMGTQQDMLDLFRSSELVEDLDLRVAEHFGFKNILNSVGQVYPRSLDFMVIASLVQISAAASNFGTTLRLMAGHELVTEGFKPGQVGSTAMPHKMNARTSERICGSYHILCGFMRMIEGPAGNQWNEGDVSCSIVRRATLSDSFFVIDGVLEAWLTVLDEFGAYPAMIKREVERYLPFLATTKLLMAALRHGMGREEAHATIKDHAVKAALLMRGEGTDENPFIKSLGADKAFPLKEKEIREVIGPPIEFTGNARSQTCRIIGEINGICAARMPDITYKPEPIL